jgi:hypothetical protein
MGRCNMPTAMVKQRIAVAKLNRRAQVLEFLKTTIRCRSCKQIARF